MLDKFFGFMKIEDELSVMETLIEHNRIDEEELLLLKTQIDYVCAHDHESVESYYAKIRKINLDSLELFEQTPDHIVNADFDRKKQYDLLRLYQRNERISNYIIASAKRALIISRIGTQIPEDLGIDIKELMNQLMIIHNEYDNALKLYIDDKKQVFSSIKKIEEIEHHMDHIRSAILATVYQLGNENKLRLGDLRAIENLADHLEETSDIIEETAASLEWLLL